MPLGFVFAFSLISAFSLLSARAGATPAVGDFVVYERSVNGELQDSVEIKLIGHKPEFQVYYKQTTVRKGTDSQVSYEPVAAHQLMSDSVIHQILQNCTQERGQLETLNVGPQTVTACRKPLEENEALGQQWIGAIPFGIVQLDYESGLDRIQLKAIEFGRGPQSP